MHQRHVQSQMHMTIQPPALIIQKRCQTFGSQVDLVEVRCYTGSVSDDSEVMQC